MNLLLDTHILLWGLLEPERLTPNVVDALSSDENRLWLSPVTTWEIMILAERKRVVLTTAAPDKWIRDVFRRIPFREAPLNHEVAIQSRQLDIQHQDPADRFLLASAIIFDLTLVTADRQLMTSRQARILANQ